MIVSAQERSRKKELYDQHEELLFRIALLEMNEEESERLEQDASLDHEMEQFFLKTQASTLHLISRVTRTQNLLRVLKTGLPRVTRFAAAFLLTVFISVSVAFAAVPEFRVSVLRFLINITDQYTELSLVRDSDSLIEIPEGWKGKYYPSFIPQGFELQYGSARFDRVQYQNALGDWLSFSELDTSTEANIDTEDAEITHILINGQPAILSEKEGRVKIAWTILNDYFVLTFDGDAETAMEIVKSVKIIE